MSIARTAVLFLGSILCLGTADATNSEPSSFAGEVAKQEAIYRTQGKDLPEGYVIDRTLSSYADTLSFDFAQKLRNLDSGDRWLDIGAGRAQAILDYYAPDYDRVHLGGRKGFGQKARAVAISVEDRRTTLWHQTAARLGARQIQYYFKKRLREYSLAELGQFQVVTDLFGGFSYTEELSVFMEKVLELLESKGTFYAVLQDVKSEKGTNAPFYSDSHYSTEIADASGAEVKVCTWLKRIGCVEVACELRTEWKPPIEVYRIHKVCAKTTVPPLRRTYYEAGTPPDRWYRLDH